MAIETEVHAGIRSEQGQRDGPRAKARFEISHVEPCEGRDQYALYRIASARTFSEWVEAVAAQWLEVVTRG